MIDKHIIFLLNNALSARTWLLQTKRLQICLLTVCFVFCRSICHIQLTRFLIWILNNSKIIKLYYVLKKKILNCYTYTCKVQVTKHASSIYPYKYNEKELLLKPWCPFLFWLSPSTVQRSFCYGDCYPKPKKIFDLKNKEFVTGIFLLPSPWWKFKTSDGSVQIQCSLFSIYSTTTLWNLL